MKFLFGLLLVLLLLGCKNPDDVQPVINSVLVNGLDESHFLAIAGEESNFRVEVSDDKGIKQLMIKLSALSSNTHTHFLSINDSVPFLQQVGFGAFDTTLIRNIGGTNHAEDFNIILPDSINGGWNMEIGVLDNNGNYTSQDFTLHVHNSQIPFITLTSITPTPAIDGVVELANPFELDQFRMTGFVVDHTGLDYLKMKLYKSSTAFWENEWTFNDGTWSFPTDNIIIDDTLTAGIYTLDTKVADIDGWTSQYKGYIKIP